MKRKRPESIEKEISRIEKEQKLAMSPAEMHRIGTQLQHRAQMGIDSQYIRTALFPEENNYDMPQPMSNVSYSRFTDKQEMTFSPTVTGGDGSGMLVWYPKTTCGPAMFFSIGDATTTPGIKLTKKEVGTAVTYEVDPSILIGDVTNYNKYFSSTALVAASINIQYCGALQSESGYMVGGLLYDQNITDLTPENIEEAEFKVTAKPGDGIRIIYLPRDEDDYQFYDAKNGNASNAGLRAPPDVFYVQKNLKFVDKPGGAAWDGATARMDTVQMPVMYRQKAPAICIFWRGFPIGPQATMRCEIVRRFNGIPLPQYREIIDLHKPARSFDAKKTTDVIYQLQLQVPTLLTHTMRSLERIKDQILRYIPNIGHIIDQGDLQGPLGLNQFAQKLALEEVGQIGQGVGTGLIWE